MAALDNPNAAPRLLQFSLTGNPISPEGCEACAKAVTSRTDLNLSLPAPDARAHSSNSAASDSKKWSESLNVYFDTLDEEAELSFEKATEQLAAIREGESCRAVHARAVEALLAAVELELNDRAPTSSKLLPRAMRWCSRNVPVLNKLLGCPGLADGSTRSANPRATVSDAPRSCNGRNNHHSQMTIHT